MEDQSCCDNLMTQVIKCANFSAKKHKDQRRKDPEATPYINHPIGCVMNPFDFGICLRLFRFSKLLKATPNYRQETNVMVIVVGCN